MCRFVAYIGKKPVVLDSIIDKPENSLINQSRQAKEGKFKYNADGFGIGWYDHTIDEKAGLFKSVQPAWNDYNLKHISKKIQSCCFLGHVRTSTFGDINRFNCHPFSHNQFLFVHNGTINGFEKIKRQLQESLSNDQFNMIRGQTDSEHFFALMLDIMYKDFTKVAINEEQLFEIFKASIKKIQSLIFPLQKTALLKVNTVLTDGKQLLATRYISEPEEQAESLYYAYGDYIDVNNSQGIMHSTKKYPNALLIASEKLTDYAEEWHEILPNYALLVNKNLDFSLHPIAIEK